MSADTDYARSIRAEAIESERGRYSQFKDTEGNIVGLWQNLK